MEVFIKNYNGDMISLFTLALTNKDVYKMINNENAYEKIKIKYNLPTFTNLKQAVKYYNYSPRKKIQVSIINDDLESVERILYAYYFKNIDPLMIYAAEYGRLEIVKYLVSRGAHDFNRAMLLAAKYGHLEVVKYLVYLGADDFNEALILAAIGGNLEVVKYLVSLGAYNYDEAMIYALDSNHPDVVEYLQTLI